MMFKKFLALGVAVAGLVAMPWVVLNTADSELVMSASEQESEIVPAAHQSPASSIRSIQDIRSIRSDRWRNALVDPEEVVAHWSTQPDFEGLQQRRPLQKRPASAYTRMPADATGILIVKFHDHARVRMSTDLQLVSRTQRNIAPIDELLADLRVHVEPAFYRSERDIARIEAKAAANSGRAQPDLAGMFHLRGTQDQLVAAAQILAAHELVEFVEFEREYRTPMSHADRELAHGSHLQQRQQEHLRRGQNNTQIGVAEGACCYESAPGCAIVLEAACAQTGGTFQGAGTTCDTACGDEGACCIDLGGGNFGCAGPVTLAACIAAEGYFQGPSTICFDDQDAPVACSDFEPECGAAGTGGCLTHGPTPFCDDNDCCTAVCNFDPFCCDEYTGDDIPPGRGPQRWDAWCAFHAQSICGDFAPPGTFPQCSGNEAPCLQPHPGTGCAVSSCCNAVCTANPACCSGTWTQQCANIAADICALEADDGATPDFTYHQGYLTASGYAAQEGVPAGYVGVLPSFGDPPIPLPGYGGEGYDLAQFEALAQYLYDEYGIGRNPDLLDQPTSRGETIRVGVVEHSAFVQPFDPEINNHEALRHVISEPGQTVLQIPGSENLDGHHGTASLGVIGGRDFITGIAEESEMYFFPIVSAEEGGRLGRAMLSAMDEFGPGDVLSFSIGPGGGTLASGERSWTMLRMAADVGITCVISAGNDCLNLDGIAQFGDEDSDVIIVGAVYPGSGIYNPFDAVPMGGNSFCRLPFSNFCNTCEQQGAVHVGAWGTMVTTAGYGALYVGQAENPNLRTYTQLYNGTSAAAPKVAGVVARLQSFAKQFYGIPLTPIQIRDLVSGNGALQCGAPNDRPDHVPGHQQNPCAGSWDYTQEADFTGATGSPIGNISLFSAGEAIASSELFTCAPFYESVHTVRGIYKFGNLFSICAFDANYFVVESVSTGPTSGPSHVIPGFERELDKVTYMVSGQIADVMAVAQTDFDVVTSVGAAAFAAPIGRDSVAFIEMFDWQARVWSTLGASFAPAGSEIAVGSIPFFGSSQFVRPEDNTVLVRVYVFAFPSSGPFDEGTQPFELRLDLIDIALDGFFQPKD